MGDITLLCEQVSGVHAVEREASPGPRQAAP